MNRRLAWIAVPAGLVLVGAGLFLALHEDPDTRAIRRLVDSMADAVEAKDVDAFVALLHQSYSDNRGNDYETVLANLRGELDGLTDISIRTRRMKIEVERGVGTVTFDVRFRAKMRRSSGRSVPVSGITGRSNPIGGGWDSISMRCIRRGEGWLVKEMVFR